MVLRPSAMIAHSTRHIRSLERLRSIEIALSVDQILGKFLTTAVVEGRKRAGEHGSRHAGNDGESSYTSPGHLLLLENFTHFLTHQRITSIILKTFLHTRDDIEKYKIESLIINHY